MSRKKVVFHVPGSTFRKQKLTLNNPETRRNAISNGGASQNGSVHRTVEMPYPFFETLKKELTALMHKLRELEKTSDCPITNALRILHRNRGLDYSAANRDELRNFFLHEEDILPSLEGSIPEKKARVDYQKLHNYLELIYAITHLTYADRLIDSVTSLRWFAGAIKEVGINPLGARALKKRFPSKAR